MSFAKQTAIPNNQPDTAFLSSYKEAEPVPLGYGCDKRGLKWMTDQFNLQQPAANQYSNYTVSSIVGVIGLGPIHRLGYIFIDGTSYFALNDDWNASGYADTPVTTWANGYPGYNSFVRVYQGLETQVADPLLASITGQQHPNYQGIAYAILFNVNWGPGATSISNVEIEAIAVPPALNGWTSSDDNLYGVNPIAAAAGILMHRRGGAGMTPYIDPVDTGAQAQLIESTGAGGGVGGRVGQQTYFHPLYTAVKDVAQVMAEMASYYDGIFQIKGGLIHFTWFPGSTPSATGLTEIDESDHVEEPDIAVPGRDQMPSLISLTYTEKDDYATRGVTAQVPRNVVAAQTQSLKRFDFPMIKGPYDGTTVNVPAIIAARLAQDAGTPETTGTSRVFRRAAVDASGNPLIAGALFILNYAPWDINRIVRVKQVTDEAKDEYVEIEWMRERGAFPTTYLAPTDVRVLPLDTPPGPINPADICPFLLPAGFGTGPLVCVLLMRPSVDYVGANIFLASATAGPFSNIGYQKYWAVHAKASGAISSTATSLTVTTAGIDMPSLQSQDAIAQGNDTLIAIIPSTGEILSVGAITMPSSGTYTLALLRGRQSSIAEGIAFNADVWLVMRSQIVAWANNEFSNVLSAGSYNATVATKYFEVQPTSASYTGTAGPTGGVALTLVNPSPSGLTVTSSSATTYTQPDGTIVPGMVASWTVPAANFVTEGGYLQVQYAVHGSGAWVGLPLILASQGSVQIGPVVSGTAYDVRIRSLTEGIEPGPWVEADNTTAAGSGGAAAAPASIVATAGQGQLIDLALPTNTDSTIKYFKFYRSTSPTGGFTFLGDSEGTQYVDTTVALGTEYWYTASSVNTSNYESAQSPVSNGATATQASLDNTTPPSAPTAPSLSGSGSTYTAGDGSVYAEQNFNIPSLPAGAAWMSLLYRITGSSNWMGANNEITLAGTWTVSDLSPNTSYDYALEAFNNDGLPNSSGPVVGGTFTSAQKAVGPATPSGGALSPTAPPRFLTGSTAWIIGTLVSWTPNTEPDLAGYEVKATATDSDGATDYLWTPFDGTGTVFGTTTANQFALYSVFPYNAYVRVRAFNNSGVRSAWLRIGSLVGYVSIGTGTISSQSQTNPRLTGVQIGGAGLSTSAKTINVDAPDTGIYVTTGGAPKELFYQNISGLGFSSKPTQGQITLNSTPTGNGIYFYYDYDDAGNSSTQAAIYVCTTDGSNLPAGAGFRYGYRFTA